MTEYNSGYSYYYPTESEIPPRLRETLGPALYAVLFRSFLATVVAGALFGSLLGFIGGFYGLLFGAGLGAALALYFGVFVFALAWGVVQFTSKSRLAMILTCIVAGAATGFLALAGPSLQDGPNAALVMGAVPALFGAIASGLAASRQLRKAEAR